MKKNTNYFWLLLLLPLGFVAWYFFASARSAPARLLPYFGPGRPYSDSVHIVPSFTFTDQHGRPFSDKQLQGKIYVTEFFFTTCGSICPIMNGNLQKLYKDLRHAEDLHFVSFTVDPETDSAEVLKAYAQRLGVNDGRWHFLTGEAPVLYRMARQGYLLDKGRPDADDAFVHTQKFALVDKEKKIRGYYDGTDSLEMLRLDQEIRLLLKEYRYRAKKNP